MKNYFLIMFLGLQSSCSLFAADAGDAAGAAALLAQLQSELGRVQVLSKEYTEILRDNSRRITEQRDAIDAKQREVDALRTDLKSSIAASAEAAATAARAGIAQDRAALQGQIEAEATAAQTRVNTAVSDMNSKANQARDDLRRQAVAHKDDLQAKLKETEETVIRENVTTRAQAERLQREKIEAEAALVGETDKLARERQDLARQAAIDDIARKAQAERNQIEATAKVKRRLMETEEAERQRIAAVQLHATVALDLEREAIAEQILRGKSVSDVVDQQIHRETRNLETQQAYYTAVRHGGRGEDVALRRLIERKKDREREELRRNYELQAEAKVRASRDEKIDARHHALRMQEEKFKGIRGLMKSAGSGVMSLLGDKRRMMYLCLAVAGTAAGIKLISVGIRFFERMLKRPSLVRETSKKSLMQRMFPKKKHESVSRLEDLIVASQLKKKLDHLSAVASAARTYGAPLPGVILYGDPGNGKTMFMKAFAAQSGMNFAMMSGGDVSALLSSGGKNIAVTELHKVFDWAIASGPTLLFVDEAGSFLKKGRSGKLSEGLAAVIDAFLSRTGTSSNRVMIVLATNHPHALDGAVASRMPVKINFPNPGFAEREKMYQDFLGQIAAQGIGLQKTAVTVAEDASSPSFAAEVARRTDGYSGRDMTMKLFDTVRREMLARNQLRITAELIASTIDSIASDTRELMLFKDVDTQAAAAA